MFLRFTLPPLLGLSFLSLPCAVAAQAPATDSAAQVAADSLRPPTDSTSKLDSIAISSDSTRPSAAAAAARTDTAVTAPEPADSILLAACGGTGERASVARDLLVIVFGPEMGPDQRAAAARSVRGTLLGPVSGEPGAYYLRVPPGGGEFQLRAAADQLIRLSQVRQVGSRACPKLPSPPEARPKPS